MNKQFFDDLANKITSTLPPAPGGIKNELEQSIRNILHNAFDKMDLVTREDFEVQSAVLQKTRIKLELLEKKLAELEQQFDIK
ncbi:MAG: accessory factor UbiK family protein [gamma proteobacterium symbiont of Bathyaustriella thionipta]|nr:accessory factor UbiK family protein [gamma proteobacterium symbiont of Bathyaustriella thionipta]MCU7950392.1 accessory factor UbiK family protein [gamma proteobacterium symbiont of Bathyaustriella thionipta]MCU7953497.1 accessory factor UbiK family protein [gamma proteobacterium symbiont of Bathyaustriella thionipta]MCU7956894.1 accessory factor UbiK family protein [gamma proteobacterium symbiont of Bathyaustriella thionipta]MCU7966536.1 accessory factor UbiK family protein [gamma proteoba